MDVWWEREESSNAALQKPKYKVGQHVRLSKSKMIFEKGYLPSWIEEVFTISKVLPTTPTTQYKVKDYNSEKIKGSFYTEELQVVDKPEVFRIEKVLETRNQRGKIQHLVKWLGYTNEFNSWVNDAAIIDL